MTPLRDLRATATARPCSRTDAAITYEQLADRVEELAARLGPARRLVLLRGRSSVDFVVASRRAHRRAPGHPRAAAAAGPGRRIGCDLRPGHRDRHRRGRRCRSTPSSVSFARAASRPRTPAVDLRIDWLAETRPALPRPPCARTRPPSRRTSISPADRGILSLPLHYCYGLSILTSHLYAGAARSSPTGRSSTPASGTSPPSTAPPGWPACRTPSINWTARVSGAADPALRHRRRRQAGAGAGDATCRAGPASRLGLLRHVRPDRGDRPHGVPAARDSPRRIPSAVGVAIPGGSLHVDARDGDVGELVYTGPNVMMGYAQVRPTWPRAPSFPSCAPATWPARSYRAVFEVVGRTSRFAKIFGLRLDLDEIERTCSAALPAACVETDGTWRSSRPAPTRRPSPRAVAALCDIPTWVIRVPRRGPPPPVRQARPPRGRRARRHG